MDRKGTIGRWVWALAPLGALALALCIWMAAHSLSGLGLVGCGAGSSCDQVLGSRWSLVLGLVPVSALAAGIYIAYLLCVLYIDRADEQLRPFIWTVLVCISAAIIGSAAWFIYVQTALVGAFCKYCMTAHCCGLLLAVITLALAFRRSSVGMKQDLASAGTGLMLALLLAVFQLLTVDRYYYEEGSSEDLPVLAGRGMPVLGSEDAEVCLELLFDYQCPHCREVHAAAEEIISRNPGRVAFVLCPSPLSPACNPYIPAGEDRFPGSCDYARLALAVWALEPGSFAEYDRWLWTGPGVEAAQERAAGLVGAGRLASYLGGEKPFLTLSLSLELFGRTTFEGKSGIPRVICGNRWVIPEVSSADDLVTVLNEAFQLDLK